MEGVLAADTNSLRETLRWATDRSTSGAGFQRFALKAQASVSGRNVALSKVNLELDGNSGEGGLTYVADGRQTLQGTLAVEGLNLTPYMSAFRFLNTERSWSRVPLELDGLSGIDVDVRISAARVTLDSFSLGQTRSRPIYRAGNLTLAIGESQASAASSRDRLRSRSRPPRQPAGAAAIQRCDARPDAGRLLRRAQRRRPRQYRPRRQRQAAPAPMNWPRLSTARSR